MQNQLSQKEKLFLQDLKSEEELCVLKYKNYAEQAQDQQLSQLFNKLSSEEQKHYDTINQLLQGNMSTIQAGQSTGLNNMAQSNSSMQSSGGNKSDKHLLHDMLSTEKYVSSSYDKSVFESAQPAIRQALQHIQKDEQSHGEQLFQYMESHGMYQVQ